MNASAPHASRLVQDLGQLLASIDLAHWDDSRATRASRQLTTIRGELDSLKKSSTDATAPLLSGLGEVIEASSPREATGTAWETFSKRVQPAYQALAIAVDPSTKPTRTRPTNYLRSGFHVATGFFALAVIRYTPHDFVLGFAAVFALFCWTLELSRQRIEWVNQACMAVLGKVAHAHERYHINSSSWYASALATLALLGTQVECGLAVMVLGIADPAAAFVGRRWGKTRFANGRSLEGSIAFVVAGLVASHLTFALAFPAVPMGTRWAMALAASVLGALAEQLMSKIDDNLSIPLAVGLGAHLAGLI
jgi:dolichol kinase